MASLFLPGGQVGDEGIVVGRLGRFDFFAQLLHLCGESLGFSGRVRGFDLGGHLGADEHAEAESEQHEQSLGLSPDWLGRGLVGIDLAGDEEEVVADTVQHDAADDHPGDFVAGTQ